MKSKKCHKKADIELIEQFIYRLAIKFYDQEVGKIYSIIKHGEDIINPAQDKCKYPHQKYYDNFKIFFITNT